MSDQNKGSSQSQPVSAPESAARNSSASMDMSKTTTPDLAALVAELREAAEKATPGEWSWWSSAFCNEGDDDAILCEGPDSDQAHSIFEGGFTRASEENQANARLIALANPYNILALLDAYAEQGRKLEAAEVDRKNEGVARFCDAETIAELMENGARTWMPIGSAQPVKNGSIIVMTSDDEPVIGQAFWHHDPKDNTWDLYWGAVSPDVEPWNEPIGETNKGLLAWQPMPEGVPAARVKQLSSAKEATCALAVSLEKAQDAVADQAVTIASQAAEIDRLKLGIRQAQEALVTDERNGDVVWFSMIETMFEHLDTVRDPDQADPVVDDFGQLLTTQGEG